MIYDNQQYIFWLLFLLLLLWSKAGYAFVEKLEQLKINIKSPGQTGRDFCFMTKAQTIETGYAIQGYEGSFHHMAARFYFDKAVNVIPCDTFRELIDVTIKEQSCKGAVMAIENSIAGSILPNYNLLQKSGLLIVGEIYLQIQQNLLVNRGVSLADIREVHSHTMALQQCYEYLDTHKWKLVESDDTALSAKQIHQHKSKHIGAIASKLSAELYGLEILAPNIQTLKNNYTRFLVLKKEKQAELIEGANKASVNFHTDHSRGSLAKLLTKIAEGGINLSKLQSFPIPGSDFKYSFHVDMEFDSADQFEDVIKAIKPMTREIKIYGIYKKGSWK